MREVNALAETLREQRLGALEATALLRKVMEEIDVAVFAFDGDAPPAAASTAPASGCWAPRRARCSGRTPSELGPRGAPGGRRAARRGRHRSRAARAAGRCAAARFRQGGLPHQLLVLADVSRALREEERQAWQRLIRVLGHELNNSLAPIQSIAGSLEQPAGARAAPARLARTTCGAGWP